MKKILAILLTLALIPCGFGVVFADVALTDIENTPYQTAIENLVEKGIIKGYPNNTFQPENTITRAEASVILVKAVNADSDALAAAKGGKFSDVADTYWGKDSINYAAENGLISGYEDGTFRPNEKISYYEMAAMLVNAAGVKANELEGEWPDNYYNKATELGFMNLVPDENSAFDGNAPATRGNVARMTNEALTLIQEANRTPGTDQPENPTTPVPDQPEQPTKPENPVTPEPEQPAKPEQKPGEDSTTGAASSTGALADYTGRAYGIVTGVSVVLNEDGETVQLLDFLYGNGPCSLITREKNTFHAGLLTNYNGELFCLKINNGVVSDVSMDGSALGAKNYTEYTKGGFEKVTEMKNGVVTLADGSSYTISDDASIYVSDTDGATADDYKTGAKRNIEKDCYVSLYSVTKNADSQGPVEIVIIKK